MGNGEWGMGNGEWAGCLFYGEWEVVPLVSRLKNAELLNKTYNFFKENRG